MRKTSKPSDGNAPLTKLSGPSGLPVARLLLLVVGVVFGLALFLLSSGCNGCDPGRTSTSSEVLAVPLPSAQSVPPALQASPLSPCEQQVAQLRAQPQLPGTPRLDEHRSEILARARAVPVVFWRAPRESATASDVVRKFRKQLREAPYPTETIRRVLHKTRGNYPLRREIFLSEKYFYAETPLLALRLSQIIRLDHLFDEERLVIERGREVLSVVREEGRYYLPPDHRYIPPGRKKPDQGSLAGLLLFDRVKLSNEEFEPPLTWDLSELARTLGFDRAQILARTEGAWGFSFATGKVVSTAVVTTQSQSPAETSGLGGAGPEPSTVTDPSRVFGTHPSPALELACETAQGPHTRKDLEEARAQALLDQELMDPVLSAAQEMIARRLPFDEPRTEEGQQDGLLRMHFSEAYRRYRGIYEFNGDEYYVFDGHGRVRLPQVCIDFITDAFDWGTGGYWPHRGERRLRTLGALNFAHLGIENSRSIESLAEYASATPEWFDVVWFAKKDQVKFRERGKFFDNLSKNSERFRLGDVVFIYGLKDDGKFHYHSFLIGEKDPLTGMPTVVLANAGPPQARSWEGEMQNAPLRAIVARMRVRRGVLLAAREQSKKHPGVPLAPPIRQEDVPEKAF